MAAPRSRLARNTAIFSVLTGLSRIMGLIREIVAASYFGTSGAASAFTLAFQVPNLLRALVADAALSSAFVPVFSELLEQRKRKEAYALASALAGLIAIALGAITVLFMVAAPLILPPFSDLSSAYDNLLVGLSRVLFPIVVLLGLNGLVVGILNANDHFTIPALSPLVWNFVIIVGLVVLAPRFEGDDRLYAYAIGVLAGTAVQLLMCLPELRRTGFGLRFSTRFRHDPRVRQVLRLMFPVSVSLGLINIDLLLNSIIGGLVSDEAPRAIDNAFRIYMLPQGMFSVAVATVVFPALARLATRKDMPGMRRMVGMGTRQILLLLIPSAVAMCVLATPMTRLVFQRGEFDAHSTEIVAEALFWFSFSLPFAGVNLLLTRSFFSLQQPWLPTRLSLISLIVNVIVSLALYQPLGIAGVVLGTAVANAVMTAQQAAALRHRIGGLQIRRTIATTFAIVVASAYLGLTALAVHTVLEDALGQSTIAQIVSVGLGLAAGGAVFLAAALAIGIPEVRQIIDRFARRAS